MNDQQAMQTTAETLEVEVSSQKLSYSSPVLQSYGAVSTLTQGKGTLGVDGSTIGRN